MSVRGLVAALAAAAITALAAAPGALAAKPPKWSSVKVQQRAYGLPWTEPRITTGPDGTLWLVTNSQNPNPTQPGPPAGQSGADARTGVAIVMYSTDNGRTWHKTPADYGGQVLASPDVDIVTTPSGRVIASELDEGTGVNFPSAFSDNRGKTWTQSLGSNTLADQDRQWLADGPVPGTNKRRVYLLFHNLVSGNANHNMYVARSDDGGKTFGVPVPITRPGEASYNDLQCADSGGPSTIFTNQRDGTVYAEFTTRGTPIQGVGDLGGCATPAAGQPLEFNIVAGTRVWLAESKDGGSTWTKSLPVDDAASGQIVSMQVAYAGLDSVGNVYVAYPESPKGKKYPDYSGAGVRYKWAHPAADAAKLKWSPARTFMPSDAKAPGNVLVHMTVGDPGRLIGAFWHGVSRGKGKAAAWYMTSAQTLNGLSSHPKVRTGRISPVAADTGTASELMGACFNVGPVSGIINGLACGRSPDVWGVTLDQRCFTHIVWPAVDVRNGHAQDNAHVATDSNPGTWVSNQVGGASLCKTRVKRPRCRDLLPPVTHITKHKVSARLIRLRGNSHDRGCVTANGLRFVAGLQRVRVSVARVRGKGKGRNCRFLTSKGRLTPRYTNCRNPILLRVRGKRHWRFSRKVHLPKGGYRIVARGRDLLHNKEKPAGYNHFNFRLK